MKRRILLADDSVTIQKVIELTFLDEDYEVRAVSNGDEAISVLAEMGPDFVIADVHMPGANGYEVCRRAKQLRQNLPVLLLVGTFEPFDEAQARNVGADSFLKKPFDSQELLQRVEELLAGTAAPPPMPFAAPAFEPSPAFAEPSFSASNLDAELPPLGGFAPAGFPQPAPEALEPSAEPVWSNFELEAEAETPSWPTPAAEPFDREPAFDLGPEPSFALQNEEPVFALDEDESTFTLQDEVAAPEDLSLGEPQDRYPAEPEPASARAGFAWSEPAPEPWMPAPEPEPVQAPEPPPVWSAPAAAAVAPPPPAVEEVRPSPVSAPAANGGGRLSDEDVDRIARRVVELLGEKTVRDVAWEVIPDMAEVIIRDRLRELEAQVELA
ncbi:MAG TPA: response regulator [Thermoanaerobaculia bacterium]|nr:response regulator [Thermoanaerobaculia bacterium]